MINPGKTVFRWFNSKPSNSKKAFAGVLISAFLIFLVFYQWHYTMSQELSHEQSSSIELYDSLMRISNSVLYSNPDSCRVVAKTALEMIGDEKITHKIIFLNILGASYHHEVEYKKALDYYFQALSLAIELNDSLRMAHVHNNIGVLNMEVGNYKDAALNHFITAKDLFYANNQDRFYATTLNNIGLVFKELKSYELANENYYKALQGFEKTKDRNGMTAALNNLAVVYANKNDYEQAFIYLNRAVELSEEDDYVFGLCKSYQTKANIYLKMGNYDKAILHYNTSLEFAETINHPYYKIFSNLGLAKTFIYKESSEKAFTYARESLDAANDIGHLVLQYESYEVLSTLYEKVGEFEKSLEHYRKHTELKDDVLNKIALHQIYDLEIKSLNDRARLQELELKSKELIIQQKKNQLVFSIIAFLLAMSGLYFVYLNYRNRQRVKMQGMTIKLNEKKSHASIEAEIQERKRIGQELHDCLGQMLSVAGMHISLLQQRKNIPENHKEKLLAAAMHSVNEAFTEVRNISHNLAPTLLSEKGLEGALKKLSDQVNQGGKLQMTYEIFGLEKNLNSLIENTLFRAVQEILNNTIKHSNASVLSFYVTQRASEINLMAEDNGQGFDISNLENMNGSGLTYMKTRVENLNGNLHIDSTSIRGTLINIVLPLNPTINDKRINTRIGG